MKYNRKIEYARQQKSQHIRSAIKFAVCHPEILAELQKCNSHTQAKLLLQDIYSIFLGHAKSQLSVQDIRKSQATRSLLHLTSSKYKSADNIRNAVMQYNYRYQTVS